MKAQETHSAILVPCNGTRLDMITSRYELVLASNNTHWPSTKLLDEEQWESC